MQNGQSDQLSFLDPSSPSPHLKIHPIFTIFKPKCVSEDPKQLVLFILYLNLCNYLIISLPISI